MTTQPEPVAPPPTGAVDLTGGNLVDAGPRRIGPFTTGPVAFGSWRIGAGDERRASELLAAALGAGMNLVDTADIYGYRGEDGGFGDTERVLGAALARSPGLRARIVLATKCGIRLPGPYCSSGDYIVASCEESLKRLGTDAIDIFQIHRPDLFTHPAEVAEALAALRREGKIREAGVSNHTPSQLETLAAFLPFPLVTQQPQYSAAHLAPLFDGTLDQCLRLSLTPLAWSPLAGGAIPRGEGLRGELTRVLDGLAAREGVTRSAVALAFVLSHPARPIPILGTTDTSRLAEATAALSVRLDRRDVYRIIEASTGAPLP